VPEFQTPSYSKRDTLLEISGQIPPGSILLDEVSETGKSFNNFLNMIEFL
jgi:hypothetical protein